MTPRGNHLLRNQKKVFHKFMKLGICEIGVGLRNVHHVQHQSEINVPVWRGILKQSLVLKRHIATLIECFLMNLRTRHKPLRLLFHPHA